MKINSDVIRDVLAFLGAALIITAASLVYIAAGLAVAGILMIAVSYLAPERGELNGDE